MRLSTLMACLMLAMPVAAAAQKDVPPSQPRETGPTTSAPRKSAPIFGRVVPGDPAPTFVLDGSNGKPVKLTSFRGNWLVLVFSDRWQAVEPLSQIEGPLRELGAQVVGMCHEKAHTLVGAAVKEKLPILALADVTGQVSAAYGLFDFGRSETQPGILIIDPKGIVQLAVLGHLAPPETIALLARFAITGL